METFKELFEASDDKDYTKFVEKITKAGWQVASENGTRGANNTEVDVKVYENRKYPNAKIKHYKTYEANKGKSESSLIRQFMEFGYDDKNKNFAQRIQISKTAGYKGSKTSMKELESFLDAITNP